MIAADVPFPLPEVSIIEVAAGQSYPVGVIRFIMPDPSGGNSAVATKINRLGRRIRDAGVTVG